MAQDLTQLPETADFKIGMWPITIRNHKVTDENAMFGSIIWIVNRTDLGRDVLNKFEKHGISYEAVIECCAKELEENPKVLDFFIKWMYVIRNSKEPTVGFSKSKRGRFIADQLVEKIRSCDNWGELYDEMQMTSKFQKDMKNRIILELKEQNRIKEEIK